MNDRVRAASSLLAGRRSQAPRRVGGATTPAWRRPAALGLLALIATAGPISTSPGADASSADDLGSRPPAVGPATRSAETAPRAIASRGELLVVANGGQLEGRVAYHASAGDTSVFFHDGGVTISVTASDDGGSDGRDARDDRVRALGAGIRPEWRGLGPESPSLDDGGGMRRRHTVRLDLVGAPGARPVGREVGPTVVSHFHGPPSEWHAGLPTFRRVVYPNAWPGIDVSWAAAPAGLELELRLRRGADPRDVRLAVTGADAVRAAEGTVEISTSVASLSVGQWRASGAGAAARPGGHEAAARASADWRVVDPGAGEGTAGRPVRERVDSSHDAVDSSHDAVDSRPDAVGGAGATTILAVDLPTALPGREFVWTSELPVGLGSANFIGGLDRDRALGVAADADGNAYVVGSTRAVNAEFPAAVGPDTVPNGGLDAYLAKIDPTGTVIRYLGFIGGANQDEGFDVAVDAEGNAYITGVTASGASSFPVRLGPVLTYRGSWDTFVTKVDPTGTDLVYSGYIGGSGRDFGEGIAVDRQGNAIVTGVTESTEATFPVAVGPDVTFNGGFDAFIAKVVAEPSEGGADGNLVYAGYVGGSGDDIGVIDDARRQLTAGHVGVDAEGNAYLSGATSTADGTFPDGDGFGDLPSPDRSYNGGTWDAWIVKVRPDGETAYAGFVGGDEFDAGFGMAIDADGSAYFGGITTSTEETFPDGDGFGDLRGPDLTANGENDAFIAKVSPDGRSLAYAGFIGGDGPDVNYGVALDREGAVYMSGFALSGPEPTFPVARGPDLTRNDDPDPVGDAFVLKLVPDPTAPDVRSNIDYAGYIGGSAFDFGFYIAVDPWGAAFVVGDTRSDETTFPDGDGMEGTPGQLRRYGADLEGFLVKVVDADMPPAPTPTATTNSPTTPTTSPPPTAGATATAPTPTTSPAGGDGRRIHLPAVRRERR